MPHAGGHWALGPAAVSELFGLRHFAGEEAQVGQERLGDSSVHEPRCEGCEQCTTPAGPLPPLL